MTEQRTKDIAAIADNLTGKIHFEKISFDQVKLGKDKESINDLVYVKSMYGCDFYTSRHSLDMVMHLINDRPAPTLVQSPISQNVYRIQ